MLRQRNKAIIHTDTGLSYVESFSRFLPSLKRRKKALLSYLTGPVIAELQNEELVRFSNHGLAVSWARVLNELGYIVDIIDWDNTEFVPKKKYDLIVFHGGKNFEQIMHNVKNQPRIIHWLTGSYWKFNNSEEDKRLADFKKRHGTTIARDRYIIDSEELVNETSDMIIVLGDPSMRSVYPSKYKKVFTVNNASYPDNHYDTHPKDYVSAKENFLFFAGSGSIHKGLDLLIDSFKDLTQHLYIVANTDRAVMNVFKKELQLPNIHLIGEVGMRTKEFYDVMGTCAYVILPSCSEGQAGSVVEAMNQGLIPIVSKETRLDATGYGYVLKNNTIAEITSAVKHFSSLTPAKVHSMSREVRLVTQAYHSPEFFRKQLKAILKKL
ncbi:MAG: glycosyl transferase group 1 [Candidatus Saccharibacteria bacterium]|nr:glycosyl transferase group 1 [Candidatus Saccharibacteria bacterium]